MRPRSPGTARPSRLYARRLSVLALSRIQFPRPELGELFVGALQHRSHLVDGFPGFHRLEVLSPARADGDYVLATWWETRADLGRWLRSHEHAETHARTPAEIAPYLREARVEIFEVRG